MNSTDERIALITGITGQDGSYLAEFLMEKGYFVHGIIRRSSSFNTGRIEHLYSNPATHQQGRMKLHYGDMTDSSSLVKIITKIKPTEIYNLAAQSHVKVSFELSEYTAEVDAVGTLRLLDAIRTCGLEKRVKFYQASTSEMFGKVYETPQKETTPFYPRSPYACAKLYAYWTVINYREAYGIFACNGILFNHESPRRGENFVTRKITRSVAKIHLGLMDCLELGNLDSLRDWGHAKDYIKAMWMMLQLDKPDDFVIATGENHSVREFVEKAFGYVGVAIVWEGCGVEEVGKDKATNVVRVRINPKFFRPTEVEQLLGDSSKARATFGWKPTIGFEVRMSTIDVLLGRWGPYLMDVWISRQDLIKDMMDSDIELMKKNPAA
ncbi:unnamed protein product [Nesidiocoris tenuis]|uniref:GDP-mannose 4,6-dehydratase n=1 Tax=Nesidiocoris tenuis TaxID=355587 RepID=A0A6H5HN83_9HEMI|nr:unnamed protein product [Nesidiocoris tenuis]CAB0019840.1 unnamed protein product [Nesidiocoris tenuis]